MKRFLLIFALSFSLIMGTVFPVFADEAADNQEAQQAADEVDEEAQDDSGKAVVVDKLKNQFGVEEALINDLRSQKMGYGEVGIALSLAEQLPGGITDDNIQQVMDLRQGDGKTGWGNVARQLELNLGETVSQTKKMTQEIQTIKKTQAVKPQSQVTSPTKPPKPASAEKPVKVPKISRPPKPSTAGGKR